MPEVDDGWSLGIDVGGTFTDLAAVLEGVVVATAKVPTTYPDPIPGIEAGIDVVTAAGLDPAGCAAVIHATTLASNAVLENKVARTGLVATAGFADTLWLRREYRFDTYSLDNRFPPVLVRPNDRVEARERVRADGAVIEPLALEPLLDAAAPLVADGVEAFAVCLLHSYANPRHEEQIADGLRTRFPDVGVVASSEVLPVAREYERSVTTVLDAALLPIMTRYLDRLGTALRARGLDCSHYAMSSAGDVLTFDRAAQHPVLLLESGPAAGHVAACHLARRLGSEVVGFDVGGTTAKVAVSVRGRPRLTRTLEVARTARLKPGSGYPVALRSIELNEIGSGGGSIARIDVAGLLEVGPESAASDPGPACYGFGGALPTVTDANLQLGYLGAESRLGGNLQLDAGAAQRALETLGDGAGASAAAVRRLVDEKMSEACRLHLVEAQVDPRTRILVAYGGGGPLHAAFIADRIGVDAIYCPREAGILSAWGLALAPLALRTTLSLLLTPGEDGFAGAWSDAWDLARARLHLPADAEPVGYERQVEMCYDGQAFSIDVDLGTCADPRAAVAPDELVERFERAYRDVYHRAVVGGRPVVTGVQLTAILRPERELAPIAIPAAAGGDAPDGAERRTVVFDGTPHETAIVPWPADDEELAMDGPAVAVADYTAAVVPPDWSVTAVAGDLLLRRTS